jgi:hypothetical protein
MSHARNRQIQDGPAPDYPPPLPELRRQVIIRDFDFGERELVVSLYKCPRIDCYMVEIGGEIINKRAGWSTALEIVRKEFSRLRVVW